MLLVFGNVILGSWIPTFLYLPILDTFDPSCAGWPLANIHLILLYKDIFTNVTLIYVNLQNTHVSKLFSPLHWFSDLDSFPDVAVRIDSTPSETAGLSEKKSRTRVPEHHFHETEAIFVLPSLQMQLKTEHKQGEMEPKETGRYTASA